MDVKNKDDCSCPRLSLSCNGTCGGGDEERVNILHEEAQLQYVSLDGNNLPHI